VNIPLVSHLDLLRCPRTHQPLIRQPDGSFATEDGAEVYPAVEGVPILIDVDHSVIGAEVVATGASSQVGRDEPRKQRSLVKRMLSPVKRSTQENIGLFVESLKAASARPLVLVIGGGTPGQGTEVLFDDDAIQILSLDIYLSPNVSFVADAHSIPLPDGSVDGVLVQAVLEHVLEPERVVAEIWRVLKPAGLVYAETPFLQQVHEAAYDFTRFTHSGHRYLFRRFDLLRSGVSGGPGTQLLWSIDYFVRGLFRSYRAGKVAKLAFFWVALLDPLIPEAHALDSASGTFFLGRKSENILSAAQIVAFYNGAG
jgi:SAM-dependent methyltransferase/uncharacterized protein YbaR (Trm112 family)